MVRRRRTRGPAAIAFAAAVALSAPGTALACTCPARYDSQCIGTAKSGVGSPYRWGHASWKTTDRAWGGADCSGFVVKAWQVPRASAITEDYHPYGTYHLFNQYHHWYAVSRAVAWKSDITGYPDPDGGGPASGHVVMYYYGDPQGNAMVLEAPGSGQRIRQAWRDISASKWRFRRRHNLIQTPGPA